MPPRTRRERQPEDHVAQGPSPLEDLPLPALALIYQHLDASTRDSVFRVSRWGRDLVLRETRSISLQPQSTLKTADCKPILRLIERAIRTASARLSLTLDARRQTNTKQLSALLRKVPQLPGWSSVSGLTLKGPKYQHPPASLSTWVPLTLQRLRLNDMSVTIKDLEHLATCAQLSSLRLDHCEMPALPAGQNPLAALASLRKLDVWSPDGSIAKGLTQLTDLVSEGVAMASMLPVLAGMSLLQELEIGSQEVGVEPEHLRQILATSSQLRSLTLFHIQLCQQGVDVLLAHGTQLNSLTVGGLHLTEDKSQSACTWKELIIRDSSDLVQVLAFTPLHSLERLQVGDGMCLPTTRPFLLFSIGRNEQRSLLHRALTNLEGCPAWQQSGPRVKVYLLVYKLQDLPPAEIMQVFRALAALVRKSLHLDIDAAKVVMDGVAVQELSTAVGPRLAGLTLSACQLTANFWPAMWAHLPGLRQLTLGNRVSAQLCTHSLVSYCKAATHPLQLELSRDCLTKLGGVDQMQQQLQQSGVTQVTVVPFHF